jgi:glycine dehydrogenase subunit 1
VPYIANTDAQRQEMLRTIGASVEELFAVIPPQLAAKSWNLPAGLGEQQTRQRVEALAAANARFKLNFLGAGFYDHFVPAAVDAVISRSEFYTAYTPYQPEMSQGTLQSIYEYQSAVCRLMGLEVSNASLYDGGTAVFEAVTMAMRITGRSRVIVDDGVNPIYRRMLATYCANLDVEVVTTPSAARADREAIAAELDDNTAAVVVANPNFFGCVDDLSDLAELAHQRGALLIASVYPISLGVLKSPGEMGVDVAVAEGQSLGLGLSFGGPWLGMMATLKKHARKMPGRIVGRTVDAAGRDGFVLTLQAREQHIRREKATSNICSNQGLCALASLVYLSLLGRDGLADLARLCADKAAYASRRLTAVAGVSVKYPDAPHFNELVIELPKPAETVVADLLKKGVAAGYPLSRDYADMDNCLLLAFTEKNSADDIDALAAALEDVL